MLDRVTVRYASDEALRSAAAPAGAAAAGRGVWTQPSGELTEVKVLLEIHNGFDSPLTMVAVKLPAVDVAGQPSLGLFCEMQPEGALAPGTSRAVMCRGSERTERIGDAVKALAERTWPTPLPPNAFHSHAGNVFNFEAPPVERRTGASPTQPPGQTAAPSASRHQRVQTATAILSFATLVLSLIAGARVKTVGVRAGVISGVAGLVVLFAAFALLILNVTARPGAGYEGLLGMVVLYFGAIPFFIALLCVVASNTGGNATPFRVFAATFGVLTFVSVFVVFALS